LVTQELTKKELVDLLHRGEIEEFNRARSEEEIDIPGLDLSGLNLRGAHFSRGNLYHVDFSGSDLTGARFGRSYLRGSNFCGANLSKALLEEADLSEANLCGADLSGARLFKVDFRGAKFDKETNFHGTCLEWSSLWGAQGLSEELKALIVVQLMKSWERHNHYLWDE